MNIWTIGSVKLGFKERLNKEQIGNSEPVYLKYQFWKK